MRKHDGRQVEKGGVGTESRRPRAPVTVRGVTLDCKNTKVLFQVVDLDLSARKENISGRVDAQNLRYGETLVELK